MAPLLVFGYVFTKVFKKVCDKIYFISHPQFNFIFLMFFLKSELKKDFSFNFLLPPLSFNFFIVIRIIDVIMYNG